MTDGCVFLVILCAASEGATQTLAKKLPIGAPFKQAKSTDTDPSAIKEQVHAQVSAAIVQVLGSSIPDNEPLMSAGLDSLGSVEFVNVLTQKLGISLPGTLVFDYPSVAAVTGHLAAQVLKSALAAAAAVATEEESRSQGDQLEESSWDLDAVAVPKELYVGDARVQRPVFVASMAPRALMADKAAVVSPHELPAGAALDRIQRVPLERWDLDLAEILQHDAQTLSAQVITVIIIFCQDPAYKYY